MQIELPPEADEHRADVRAFVEREAPGGTFPDDWNQRLARAGYVAPHWPKPWGRDAGPVAQLAIDQELRAVGAPKPFNPIGIGWAGPTLMVAGTEAQQQKWLPAILDGSEIWCQLFSEPDAGSDLASLKTRAVRDGDEYVINGQKVWTSYAHVARWAILLARTADTEKPHRGISYFVLDMTAPGVEVRPIRQMNGGTEFNEVFFTDVRIPAANLVGEENGGWRLAKVTLGNERVSLSGEGLLWGNGPTVDTLLNEVRDNGGVSDPVMRQKLAGLFVEQEVLRLLRMRTVWAQLRGLEPGPEASIRKALADEHGMRAFEVAEELAGAHAMLLDGGLFGRETTLWASGFLYSRALTIGGGTSEVQRNIIGEKILGLPR